ncbi:MAG TPA: TonB-dependent receptor [Chitinophagaceae bacterium]|nr:TonB-dependent receptor [Chitinophagaceae bacterium]
MKKSRRITIALLVNLLSIACLAQTTLTGTVRSSTNKNPVPAVTVIVKGSSQGTYTDENGVYKITVSKLPVTLVFSSVNFATQELTVSSATQALDIDMAEASSLGQEVVISASRTPERILESPVSIERVSLATIRTAPASTYYDIVTTLKGVDVIASSLTFKTPTTRGFGGSGSTRFNQIVDGMDNQAPGLNFSVGSVIGLTELDVESMELLPGASSALYGPGGMNGTLLINSKNPFKYPGLSFQVKTGMMHTDNVQRKLSPYYNWSLRWAHKFSEKFAFKIGSELIQAKDWLADDYRNYRRIGTNGTIVDGTRETDPNYDGVNVYGDETSINLKTLVLDAFAAQVPFWAPYISSLPSTIQVSRTGYTEKEVANPNTINYKLSGALHYKLTNSIEAILAGHIGTGNTVYTGSQRYSLKDLKMAQYKLELRSDKWYIRGYTTQENAGESHNLTITTQLFNEVWKPSSTWYQQYGFAYINAKMAGRPDLEAHNIARATADVGRPEAGTNQFRAIYDQVRKKPIPTGGLFLDRTDLWMVDGQYNFSSMIKVVDVIVGANWKKYILNSEGTLFADKPGDPIEISEMGAYIQVGREIIKDVFKLTAAGRYDKNENFEGRFTPRVTALVKPAKDHNIRLSFQTAYRFPSTQQQWIDLDVGTGRLIGSTIELWQKYDLINNPGYASSASGIDFTQRVPYVQVKPESVTTFELGYKSLINRKILIDAYGYYGKYQDFISRRDVAQVPGGVPGPNYSGYSIVVNSPSTVKTFGWGASVEWLLPWNFTASGNISSDKLKDVPTGFRAFFATPELRYVLSLANSGFGPKKLLGFNVSWRWQEGFFYENDFAQGDLPAFNVVDAAISYKRPAIKSMFKLGATNLLNQYYRTAVGNPSIGGLYYLSFAYNVL